MSSSYSAGAAETCRARMCKAGVSTRKDYKKYSVLNHPDKVCSGLEGDAFQRCSESWREVNDCASLELYCRATPYTTEDLASLLYNNIVEVASLAAREARENPNDAAALFDSVILKYGRAIEFHPASVNTKVEQIKAYLREIAAIGNFSPEEDYDITGSSTRPHQSNVAMQPYTDDDVTEDIENRLRKVAKIRNEAEYAYRQGNVKLLDDYLKVSEKMFDARLMGIDKRYAIIHAQIGNLGRFIRHKLDELSARAPTRANGPRKKMPIPNARRVSRSLSSGRRSKPAGSRRKISKKRTPARKRKSSRRSKTSRRSRPARKRGPSRPVRRRRS